MAGELGHTVPSVNNSMVATTKAPARMPIVPMCACALCLGVFLFASVFGGTQSVWITFEWFVAAVALRVLWRLLVRANEWTKHWDFFSPGVAFVGAYVAWFSLGSINIIDMPDSIMGGVFSPIPASQWLFYVFGLAGYGMGLLIARSKMHPHPWEVHFQSRWGAGRFWVLVAVTSAAMLGALALQVAQFGVPGLSTLAGEERLGIRGIPHFVFVSCAFMLLVVVPAYLWARPTRRWVRMAATGLVIFTALTVPLLQGGRSDLVVSFLTVFLVFHYLKKRSTLFTLLAVGGTAIVILSLIGYLRDYFLAYGQGMEWLEGLGLPGWALPIGYALLYVRYSVGTFRDVITVIPSHVPYQHGALTLAALNTVLPGHHETSDMFFKNILGSDFVGGGQPATLLGPLYGDFGALGIFAGMFLFGLVTAVSYRLMISRQTVLSVILYGWILQTGFMGLFGSLFTYISTLSMPLLWFVFDWLARARPEGFKGTGTGLHWGYPPKACADAQ